MYLYSLSVAKTAADADWRFCLGLHLAIVGWLTLSPAFIVAQGPAGEMNATNWLPTVSGCASPTSQRASS